MIVKPIRVDTTFWYCVELRSYPEKTLPEIPLPEKKSLSSPRHDVVLTVYVDAMLPPLVI